MSRISFIIPSYRARQTIGATLRSIRSQETGHDVDTVVVDSSEDETDPWIQQNHPGTQVIHSTARLFPGAARNRGAAQSDAEYFAFLDADAEADALWLETLHSKLSGNPKIRAIGGAVANANPQPAASRVLHWIEFSEFLPGLPAGFRRSLSSSNLLIRREDFLSRGGFDENFAMAEDLIFSQQFKGELYFESSTGIRHYHRSSWPAVFDHLRNLGYWSGRYRNTYASQTAWFRHVPVLAFGIPFVRLMKILARIYRHNSKDGLRATLSAPLLMVGLWKWSLGFYNGLKGKPILR